MPVKTLILQAPYVAVTRTRVSLDQLPEGWILTAQATGEVGAGAITNLPARGSCYAQADLCVNQPDGSCLPIATLWAGYVSPFPSGAVSLPGCKIQQGYCITLTTYGNAAAPAAPGRLIEFKFVVTDEKPEGPGGIFWEPPTNPAPAALPG